MKIVVALCPDIEPAAASKTASGTADASSTTSKTCSEWTPARASGLSALLVLADMKLLSGAPFSTILSENTSKLSRRTGGSLLIHDFNSANKASNNCAAVGAVTTPFCGYRQVMCQINAQEQAVDLPTP